MDKEDKNIIRGYLEQEASQEEISQTIEKPKKMNKKILIITGIILVAVGALVFVFLNKPEPASELSGKCGDGICGEIEKTKGFCPEDCEEKIENVTLINTINLGGNVARPEIVIDDKYAYIVYHQKSVPTHNFAVDIYSKDFSSKISEKILVSKDLKYGIVTDIRIDSDDEHLYAFYEMANGQTQTTSLFGVKYRMDIDFDLVAETGLIAQSKTFKQSQSGDELLDDPMVLVTESEIIMITRYKEPSKPSSEMKYKVYKFTKDLVKKEEFDLNLSSIANGYARQGSIVKKGDYYYMITAISVGLASNPKFEFDNNVPADLMMIKLNEDWKIVGSKVISDDENSVETYVTGFDVENNYFYVGYKHIPQPIINMTGMLKIYDEEFNLVTEKEVETITSDRNTPDQMRLSLEVYADRLYYAVDNNLFIYQL